MTLQEEREAIVAEYKEKFTYGVLYSASSDLSAGKGDHFKRDDAVPTIDWLRHALLSHEEKVVARVREEERSKWSAWIQHDVTCYLYTEEGDNRDCTCGLTFALTLPITDEKV